MSRKPPVYIFHACLADVAYAASYKGKALKSPSGKDDMCQDYAKRAAEFNQCAKK